MLHKLSILKTVFKYITKKVNMVIMELSNLAIYLFSLTKRDKDLRLDNSLSDINCQYLKQFLKHYTCFKIYHEKSKYGYNIQLKNGNNNCTEN